MRTWTISRGGAAVAALLLLCLAVAGCGGDDEPAVEGLYEISDAEAAGYDTAYIAAVQIPTDENDGYILLRNNWDGPADVGGWAIVGRNNRRFSIPPSTIMEPKGDLRISLESGTNASDALFLDVEDEILEWDRLRLVDAADETVARFTYGR